MKVDLDKLDELFDSEDTCGWLEAIDEAYPDMRNEILHLRMENETLRSDLTVQVEISRNRGC